MIERPILFSGPMVRAILEGRKTQTRRVCVMPWKGRRVIQSSDDGEWYDADCISPGRKAPCPYGVPGDRLWVKESIRHLGTYINGALELDESVYVADGEQTVADAWPWKLKTLPAMFCPKGLSRLTLEVKAVRVERLQEISEADAKAEGVEVYDGIGAEQRVPGPGFDGVRMWDEPHRLPFSDLWDDINAKRGHSWESNPWVWVVEFEKVTGK